jgi:hypothetical protein
MSSESRIEPHAIEKVERCKILYLVLDHLFLDILMMHARGQYAHLKWGGWEDTSGNVHVPCT